mmetsp:Transcript_34126/g.93827  ORF Transcript_34126/g.93827 Transcript_34126/m.93827 type:complete len:220 (+) Transcript_34126:257-916(+)
MSFRSLCSAFCSRLESTVSGSCSDAGTRSSIGSDLPRAVDHAAIPSFTRRASAPMLRSESSIAAEVRPVAHTTAIDWRGSTCARRKVSSIDAAGSRMRALCLPSAARLVPEPLCLPSAVRLVPEPDGPSADRLFDDIDLRRCCWTSPSNGTFLAPGTWPSRWSPYLTRPSLTTLKSDSFFSPEKKEGRRQSTTCTRCSRRLSTTCETSICIPGSSAAPS